VSGYDVVLADVLDVKLGFEGVNEGGFWLFYPKVWESIKLGHGYVPLAMLIFPRPSLHLHPS